MKLRASLALLAAMMAALPATPLTAAEPPATPAWVRRDVSPEGRRGHALAFDSKRQRLVLFGGIAGQGPVADTWEWDGETWTRRQLATAPPARFFPVIVYDDRRDVVVLFGGIRDGVRLDDTWEYDGTVWTKRSPIVSPPARSVHAMTYDADRGRVVLFGGVTDTFGTFNDTWEYDGTTWIPVAPIGLLNPPARSFHAMSYDSDRKKTVVFGGWSGSTGPGRLSDTWEWDGRVWARVLTTATPRAREMQAMAYDPVRKRTVMYGGDVALFEAYAGDTWLYDGTTWVQSETQPAPQFRAQHAMAWDPVRGRVALFGGEAGFSRRLHRDTWEWDGERWHDATPDPAPTGRTSHAMAFDASRNVTVLFGGVRDGLPSSTTTRLADTWEWDGAVWRPRSPTVSPPARAAHAMAFHAASEKIVVFGGTGTDGKALGDTWEWDGDTWVRRTSDPSPPARRFGAMAYDPVRRVTVLFGGTGSDNKSLGDTWEWDGERWTERSAAVAPSARWGPMMAYAPDAGGVLLFAGYATGQRDDTWLLDGEGWTQQAPSVSPPSRYGGGLAGTPDGVFLFGGCCQSGQLGDTWRWSNGQWSAVDLAAAPTPRSEPAVASDTHRGRVVLFSGAEDWGASPDTWELDLGVT